MAAYSEYLKWGARQNTLGRVRVLEEWRVARDS